MHRIGSMLIKMKFQISEWLSKVSQMCSQLYSWVHPARRCPGIICGAGFFPFRAKLDEEAMLFLILVESGLLAVKSCCKEGRREEDCEWRASFNFLRDLRKLLHYSGTY